MSTTIETLRVAQASVRQLALKLHQHAAEIGEDNAAHLLRTVAGLINGQADLLNTIIAVRESPR